MFQAIILKIVNPQKISYFNGDLSTNLIVEAALKVNKKLASAQLDTAEEVPLDIYDIIDLRMLSGLIGEMFIAELSSISQGKLLKNPDIDGYPDLCDISNIKDNDIKNYPFNYFKAYPHGGIEVKNTFGVKKPKTDLKPRDSRLGKIQKKLVWKAHHQYTNNLLALHSDYISNIPQVIGIYYANNLTISDWTITQKPKEGSTMTSFCQTETSGFIKIKQGLICFKEGIGYEHFI